jgi:hypothetical protein
MNTPTALDKRYSSDVQQLGKINIRVIVLPRKDDNGNDAMPLTPEEDDFALAVGSGKTPIDSYLERSDGRGKMCVLFTLNGQRHDALDASFIAKDLEFRYLRTRTLILVELDELTQRAHAKMLKGDRVGLYRGEGFNAIRKRLIDTLKGDPDLNRLEMEAEEQVAELSTGSEAIRKKLDQLIEAQFKNEGQPPIDVLPAGTPPSLAFGNSKSQTVVIGIGGNGGVTGPILVSIGPSTLRIRPDGERVLDVRSTPAEAWKTMKALTTRLHPAIEELEAKVEDIEDGKRITLRFNEGENADEDQYPIETTLQVIAKFEGQGELRLVEKDIVISPAKERPPRPSPELVDDPTWLRVATRQPVKLIPGGPLAHVRVKWDGKDELISGLSPTWEIHARCTTITSFPVVTRTDPRNGRFELLIDTPRALLAGQELDFEVESRGPSGKVLRANFRARLEPPADEETETPGTKKKKVPELKPSRPYELRFVREADWDTMEYWNKPNWDGQSVGDFRPPTKKEPLVLFVNEDHEPIKRARDEMVKKGLIEATIEERVTKYYTHVALHLYSMYRHKMKLEEEQNISGDGERLPETAEADFMEGEIERAANTVLRLLP